MSIIAAEGIKNPIGGGDFSISSNLTVGGSIKGTARAVNTQTGTTYTFALTDAGKVVTFDNGSAQTITVPKNAAVAFAVGAQIDCLALGAGEVTFVPVDGDVTINSKDGTFSISGQYVVASLLKVATDTWILFGDPPGISALTIYDNGNSGATTTIDWDNGQVQKITLTDNCTFTFSNPVAGTQYKLYLIQDGTGGRTHTWTGGGLSIVWDKNFEPSWVTTASAVNIAFFDYDGTTWRGAGWTPS